MCCNEGIFKRFGKSSIDMVYGVIKKCIIVSYTVVCFNVIDRWIGTILLPANCSFFWMVLRLNFVLFLLSSATV